MTEIYELDYANVNERETIRNFAVAANSHVDTARPEAAGAFETAGLIWQQETMIGSAITYGFSKDKHQLNYEYDKTFNPIRLWHQNQDKYGDISPYIRQGMFNDVVSEKQFMERRERLLDEQQRRERLANGSGWGMFMGMGLSLLDIATLIPIGGWVTKGNTLAKVGKMAIAGSTLTAAQEVALHMGQDLRTNEESLMNIGLAAPIGGGFGLFASALNPASRLNINHPEFPFHRNNRIPMGLARMGDSISESVIIQPFVKGGKNTFEFVRDSSVGAATVKAGNVVKAGVFTKPLKALHQATPVGRMLYAKSDKVRDIGQKLFDTGGMLTDTMASGQVTRSVEDYKGLYMNEFNNIFITAADRYNQLREALEKMTGGVQNQTVRATADTMRQAGRFFRDQANVARGRDAETGVGGRHFEDFEFQDITYKILFEDLDEGTIENLVGRFGDKGADEIIKTARKQAGNIHEINGRMEDLMVNAGMIKEAQRMGDEYGLAQLWNPRAMRGANRQAARNFFMAKFLGNPNNNPTERYPNGYLMDEFGMTDDQFALLGREEVKIGDEVFTVERGLDQRTEILEDWSGDTFNQGVLKAEMDLATAEAALEAARKEAVWSSRDLRVSETEYRKSSVAEAKKILERRMLERDRAIAEREKLGLERQALDTEVRRLEAEQEVRMNQFHDTGRWTRKYTGERTKDVEGAEGLLSHLEAEKGGAPHADIQEARMMLTEADNELARVGDDALDAAVADAATKPVYSRALAKLKERQAQIARQTSKLDSRLERLEPRLAKVSQAVDAASQAVLRVRQSRVGLRAAKNEAAKGVRAERRNVRKARRTLRRDYGLGQAGGNPNKDWLSANYKLDLETYQKLGKEEVTINGQTYDIDAGKAFKTEIRQTHKSQGIVKKGTGKKLPVHEYVDDLVDKLGKQSKLPRGILESEVFASGRTKDRQIHLTKEERREAIRLGLLRNDLYGVMHSAHEDIATRLAMRKVFGTEDVNDIIPGVRDEYDQMIAQARKRTDLKNPDKYIRRLEAERTERIKDIQGSWEKHLGIHGLPDDPDGFIHWSLQKLRAWNFIKYGTGFLVSSLTDPASVALTSGFHALSTDNWKAMQRAMKGMSSDEIRRWAITSERVLHNSRTLKIADVQDIRTMAGIGDQGTPKHNITSGIDRAMQGMSDTASVLSGMIWWNTRLKALGMMEMQHNLVGLMKQYPDLMAKASAGNKKAQLKISKLASIGIGQEQAARIGRMMEKHEPIKTDGIYEIEMSRWIDEGEIGAQAYEDVEFALRRVANRAVMTPGVGETPLLMSQGFYKTMLQFQTYGFVVLNRFITPALQRGISYGDMEAILSMGLAAGLGTGVVGIKDLLRTGEIKERNAGEWAYDILDRSGYLMYLTVPASGAFTAANVAFGLKSAPSRYANQNSVFGFLGGPSANTLMDLSGLAGGAMYGDADAMGAAASKLIPFQILKQVGDHVVEFGD